MESIQAGPYHWSSISVSHEVYSWGLDRFGSTGLPIKEKQYIQKQDRIVHQPRSVVYLVREFEKNKEKNKVFADTKAMFIDKNLKDKAKDKAIEQPAQVDDFDDVDGAEEEEEKKETHVVNDKDFDSKSKKETAFLKPPKRKEVTMLVKNKNTSSQVNLVDEVNEIQAPMEFVDKSNIQSLILAKSDKFHALHKYLVEEKRNKWDEMSIIRLNKKLERYLNEILEKIKENILLSRERRSYQLKIETSFISRISDVPFKIENIFREKQKIMQ